MAWIESHQDLARHPKARRLARKLGVNLPQVLGHLHLIWWWALDFAPDGILANYEPEDIAEAAAWDGDAELFVEALMQERWIDKENMKLHDWYEYAGKLIDRREKDAIRKKGERSPKDKKSMSDGSPMDGARNSNSTINSTDTEPNSTLTNSLSSKHTVTDNAPPRGSTPFPENLGNESKPEMAVDPIVEVYDAYSELHKKIPGQLNQSEISSIKRLVSLGIPSEFIAQTMRKVYEDKKHREDEVEKIGFRPPSSFKYYEQSIKSAWQVNLSLQEGVVIDSSGLQPKTRNTLGYSGSRGFNKHREKPQMVARSGESQPPTEEELENMRLRAERLDSKFNKPNPLLRVESG